MTGPTTTLSLEQLEQHRAELTGFCYRMLGSPFDAEDAVQDTLFRAWQKIGSFEGRSSLRSWLYRIATNVCLDMLKAPQRRARPMDLGPAGAPVAENLAVQPEITWIEPIPDPAETAVARDGVRLAFIAALQMLPSKQRAALILCEVLRWSAGDVAELLGTSVPAINSALQRARATIAGSAPAPVPLSGRDRELLERYVAAFEAYDFEALSALIHEDAIQSMPPYDLWLRGRDDIFTWWLGPGIGCKGSRVIPTVAANGTPAFGQYKPDRSGGYVPWALQVIEVRDGRIAEFTFFLSTERLFPLFGLPLWIEG